jgi:very-short-patch-repair endonuclease
VAEFAFPASPLVFTRGEALARGITPGRLAGPRFRRLVHGIHADSSLDVDWRLRAAAALLAVPGAVLSHATAAECWRLPQFVSSPNVHLTVVPPRQAPRRREIAAHERTLRADEVTVARGWPVTTPARTFLDLAEMLDAPHLVAIGDAMLRAGLTDHGALERAVASACGRRGVRTARFAVTRLDARADSPAESLLRMRLEAAGLPRPQVNVDVFDSAGGWIARPDLLYPKARIAIEYEGAHHRELRQFRQDAVRDHLVVEAGYVVLRATARDLDAGATSLTDAIAALLRSRAGPAAADSADIAAVGP